MKSVLVTGAGGFIGKYVVDSFRNKPYKIVEAGNSSDLNLCNQSYVLSLPATDFIIHLAAKSFVPDAFKDPSAFYSNNFLSTLHILELARKNNSTVIFFSTYVYGHPIYLPIDEEHPVSPLNPYTQSKVICEKLCQSYSIDFGVPVTIFRPFNIYGAGQKNNFLIPKIISQLKAQSICLDDPLPRRDYIYIDDVIEAIQLSLSYFHNGCKIFNLGSGHSVSVGELVSNIKNLAKSKADVLFSKNKRLGEIYETIADITKAKNELGWYPRTSLDEGLFKTISTATVLTGN